MGAQNSKALEEFKKVGYSIKLGEAQPGETAIHRHPSYGMVDGAPRPLPHSIPADPKTGAKEANTLFEIFQRGVHISGNGPCMGVRARQADGTLGKYEFLTYNECYARSLALGSAMKTKGLVDKNSEGLSIVGLFSKNRVEWVLAEQACNAFGWTNCALYDTLGPDAVRYVLEQTELSVCCCSSAELPKLTEVAGPLLPNLKYIIQYESEVDGNERQKASKAGVTIFTFAELEAAGKADLQKETPPQPDDVALFCYTSGTTGDPKGAMLTHRNMVSDLRGAVEAGFMLEAADVHISYLPLAHVFERIVQAGLWQAGASLGFFQGDTLKLLEDIKVLRPTVFPSVPRLWNRIFDKISAGVAESAVKSTLFNSGYKAKKEGLDQGYYTHGFWDAIIFGKVKTKIGLDRCRLMITGSAPIRSDVMDFLQIVFGCPLMEGYGQTECAAAATISNAADTTGGHVGGPLPNNEVKLVDVEEMGYRSTDTMHPMEARKGEEQIACDGRGEICFRGPNVFAGYFKNSKKTNEAMDEDGWLHSGDVGVWLPNGALKVVDRVKNIFKLSQGEYVAAEKVEQTYIKSKLVAQAFCHGTSLESECVGVVVADKDAAKKWANANGLGELSHEDLCKNAAFKAAVKGSMEEAAKADELRSFEKIKEFYIEPVEWVPQSAEVPDGVLTPTFKLKRNDCKNKYLDHLEKAYADLKAARDARAAAKK